MRRRGIEADGERAALFVASVPLTGQAWRLLAEGELLAVRHREVLATHLPAPA